MSRSTQIWLTAGACLAVAIALFVHDARAQFYIGAEGGWTALPDQDITVPGLFSTSLRFNSGFNAGARPAMSGALGALRKNTAIAKTTCPAISRCSAFLSTGSAATGTPIRS